MFHIESCEAQCTFRATKRSGAKRNPLFGCSVRRKFHAGRSADQRLGSMVKHLCQLSRFLQPTQYHLHRVPELAGLLNRTMFISAGAGAEPGPPALLAQLGLHLRDWPSTVPQNSRLQFQAGCLSSLGCWTRLHLSQLAPGRTRSISLCCRRWVYRPPSRRRRCWRRPSMWRRCRPRTPRWRRQGGTVCDAVGTGLDCFLRMQVRLLPEVSSDSMKAICCKVCLGRYNTIMALPRKMDE